MTLTPQWLDELRSRTTLSTLIERTVKVQKAGREYKACCPFHQEKTPSFTINDEKGFYHCFGCSAHGDAIRWMTDQRGLSFIDAVKELAAEAGMQVPEADAKAARQQEQRITLYDVMADAQNWFSERLNSVEGSDARDYLSRRGLSQQTIEQFGFGYAPDDRGRLKDALSGHGEDRLIEAGLLIKVDDKPAYDRFRGRLMIPIRDARGRVIAFGGRILGAGEPKYLNSPDTPLFDKGRTLYNLDRASPASRASGRVIVVEGYMDVIALAQAGFPDAVAPLGTALTETQLAMLWKMVERPILCFDGDNAGQKAAMRACGRALPLLQPAHSLLIAAMPPGQDPDDVVKSGGATAFNQLLSQSRPLADFLWQAEWTAQPLDSPEAKAGLRQRLRAHCDDIGHSDIAQHYRKFFDDRYQSAFFTTPRPALRGPKSARTPLKPLIGAPKDATRTALASNSDLGVFKSIVGGLLRYPDLTRANFEALSALQIPDPSLAGLLQKILKLAVQEERLESEALLTILGQDIQYNMAKELLRADALHFSFNRTLAEPASEAMKERVWRELAEVINVMAGQPEIERALQQATIQAQTHLDEDSFAEQQRLLGLKQSFEQRLIELTQSDD